MKKWYDIIPYLIFGLGIIMDIGVNITGIYIIPVTESYMDNIFVGIITVSVLCFTLVTLIASFLDNSYLGYKLKDIIQFPNSPVNTKKYIRVSLLVITIGVCLLGMNFVVNCANSMTTLLLALILIEGNVAFKIWKMIINESYVFDLVISHFTASVNNKMDLKEFQSHTDTVINALSTAIYERNYVEKNKTCEMLTALSAQVQARGEQDGYYDYYKYFDTKLRTYMDDFAKVFGYNDMETGLLKDDFVKQYKQYENLLEHSSNITEQIQIKLFQYICEAHSNLRKKKIIESEPRSIDIDYKDVMIRINELMKKDGILGWNSQYFTEDYVKFVMPDYISRRAYRTPQNTARTIQRGIIEALKSYIRQRANKLTLTFDIDGVRNMLMFICENEYDARNYTYTDDWSLAKLRNEPEFIKLEEKQKEIEFVGTPQIYDNLYFNKEKFCFNIKISKMDFIDLSERECEAFLEDSKGYNGLYNVDGALMPKEEAMKCIKKSYCKERYSFKLMVGFGKNDVTRIEFEH